MENKNNEKFDDFVQKVLDLQKKKDASDEQLSEEALWEIAQVMGLDAEDLHTAKQDYLTRGTQHLAHQNWQNARKEFEELLTISPKNMDGNFGLALAYEGLWQQHDNEADKQKALALAEKVLELAPDYAQAYELINRLQTPKTEARQEFGFDFDQLFEQATKSTHTSSHTHTHTTTTTVISSTPKNNNKNARWFAVLLPLFILGIVGYNLRSVLFGVPQNTQTQTQGIKVVATPDGLVTWVLQQGIVMTGGMTHTYTAQIIGHPKGNTLATVTLAEGVSITSHLELTRVKDQVLVFNADQMILELRDARTGEVTENLIQTLEAMPELVKGVGTIAKKRHWIKVTSGSGETYYYSPYFRQLVKHRDSKPTIDDYLWLTKEQGQSTRLSLVKTKVNQGNYNTEQKKQARNVSSRYSQTIGQSSTSYLNAQFVFGNEYFCIIFHDNKVGKNSQRILTAIDRNGQVMWENMQPQSEVLTYKGKYSKLVRVPQSAYHNNVVAAYIQADKKGVIGIDTKTGKILWEEMVE